MLNRFLQLLLVILFSVNGFSQTKVNSPYSRYGIGDLNDLGLIRNISTGGTSIAVQSDFSINFNNPASLAEISPKSILFETGLKTQYNYLQTENSSNQSSNSNFNHFALAFPISKIGGLGIGVLPYSTVSYDIKESGTLNDENNTEILNSYEGFGGVNRAIISFGLKPVKGLYVGASSSYLFGKIENSSKVYFDPEGESTSYLNTANNTIRNISGSVFDFGFQYKLPFKDTFNNSLDVVIGAKYSLEKELDFSEDILASRFIKINDNYDETYDTISLVEGIDGSLLIPQNMGFGVSIARKDTFMVSLEYKTTNWSDYSINGESQSLRNTTEVRLGCEIIPNINHTNTGKFGEKFNWVRYRLGVYYSETYLKLNDTELNKTGITFGLGYPIGRFPAKSYGNIFNIGVDLGKYGTTENNLYENTYTNVYIGLVIKDLWFLRSKIK